MKRSFLLFLTFLFCFNITGCISNEPVKQDADIVGTQSTKNDGTEKLSNDYRLFFLVIILLQIIQIVLYFDNKSSLKQIKNAMNDEDAKNSYFGTINNISTSIDSLKKKIDLSLPKINNEIGVICNDLKYGILDLKKEVEKLSIQLVKDNVELKDNLGNVPSNNKNDEFIFSQKKPSQPITYFYLAVQDNQENKLVENPESTPYYKAWREDGVIKFVFNNNDKTKKAINNRSTIIDPFCEKIEPSKTPDESDRIETDTPGILDENFNLRFKAKIKYA